MTLYTALLNKLLAFKLLIFSLVIFTIVVSCKDRTETPEANNEPLERNTELMANRTLKEITLSGSGYELGFQHGQKLKTEIGEIVLKWHENTSKVLNTDSHQVLKDFMNYAQFKGAIQEWTPDLYEEVRGIAEGSGQNFEDILVLNLLDEFWVYLDDPSNHHCSDIGVPSRNGNPAIVAQNMDIESYTDGYQTLVHLEGYKDHPTQLLLTHPGLIVLNGMNEKGVGVVVNTIMQLKASPDGLPVAFVIRKILSLSDKGEILRFLQEVPHASGQNYIVGIDGEVFDFEASAGKIVPFSPGNDNGTVYHTNHPIVNDNLKPWHGPYNPNNLEAQLPIKDNSYIRFSSLEKGIKTTEAITSENIMDILRSKDDPLNPVCRTWAPGKGFTFASTIMSLGSPPKMYITAGPPDESEYSAYGFE